MTKKVEIKIPVKGGDGQMLSKATGVVAWFYVGETKTKFLIQDSRFGLPEKLLVHFATGYSLGSTSPEKLRHYRTGKSLTEREAARLTLERIVGFCGLEKLEEVIEFTPVIN